MKTLIILLSLISFCFGQYDKYPRYPNYISTDTTVIVDTTPPDLVNLAVTFDTLGTDSTEWSATTWPTDVASFWIGFDDTTRITAADTSNCDSLIFVSAGDTSSTFKWKHEQPSGTFVYYLLVAQDSLGNQAVDDGAYYIVHTDATPPNAGTITTNEFLPPNNVHLVWTDSDCTDVDEVKFEYKTESANSYLTLFLGDSTVNDTSISIVGLLFFAGDDSGFGKLTWTDGYSNSTTIYDTVLYPAPYYTLTADTSDSSLDGMTKEQFWITNIDSNSGGDSTYYVSYADDVIMNGVDSLDMILQDTLITQHSPASDTIWVAVKPWWGNIEGSWSNWVSYTEVSGGAAASDSITFFWRCEGTTLGADDYTDGDGTADVSDGASITTAQKVVGDSALECADFQDHALFVATSIIDGDVGSIGMWVRMTNTGASNCWKMTDGTDYILIRVDVGAPTLWEVRQYISSVNTYPCELDSAFTADTWYWLQYSWSATANIRELSMYNSAGTLIQTKTNTDAYSGFTGANVFEIGNNAGTDPNQYIDNVIVTNNYLTKPFQWRSETASPK